MAALRNFNGLASQRNAENSLQSVNLTMPNLDVLFIASDAAVRSCGWRAGRAAPAPCSPCRGEPALHRTRSDRTARGISRASPGAPRAPDRGSLPESPSSRPVRRHPLADSAGPRPQRPNTQWPDRCREPLRRSRRDAGCRRSRRHKRTGPHRARSRYPTARFVRSPPCSVGLPLALRGIGPPHSSVNRDILWRHIPPSRFMFIRQDRGNSCRSSKIRSYSAGYGSAQAATPYPVFVSEAGECKPLTTTGPS